ncbi:MAG: hypothetical protein RL329_1064 [Bacteroidota bacterium]
MYIQNIVANDRTDAAPRSRALRVGFARGCRAVLLFSTVFFNIIIVPIETEIPQFFLRIS